MATSVSPVVAQLARVALGWSGSDNALLVEHKRDLEELGKEGGTTGCTSRGNEPSCLLLHME